MRRRYGMDRRETAMSFGHPQPDRRRLAPLPENLFREPIDFLIADHARIRTACDELKALAQSEFGNVSIVQQLLTFLARDLASHFGDEEEVLVPRLRQNWPSANRIELERILNRLQTQHRHDLALSGRLLPFLSRMIAGKSVGDSKNFADDASSLAASLRRNLAWEEEALLHPARHHLSGADLTAIGRAMAARRGVAYPEPD